jgi:hypothetical protein
MIKAFKRNNKHADSRSAEALPILPTHRHLSKNKQTILYTKQWVKINFSGIRQRYFPMNYNDFSHSLVKLEKGSKGIVVAHEKHLQRHR